MPVLVPRRAKKTVGRASSEQSKPVGRQPNRIAPTHSVGATQSHSNVTLPKKMRHSRTFFSSAREVLEFGRPLGRPNSKTSRASIRPPLVPVYI